ncbi:hypothetical protein DM02DRAFT_665500 [Periconia macrospinosa]|uniref:Uncharacterized protein n=1 Tax=Periconia macrospinosa TaxID=97972 RepID=A0A2V1CWR0_9PLEO|nr:hypothetical protein DM02DRAFT_665500 [Periconia macrospinosa]
MKRCDHTHWLSVFTQGTETALLESDRLQKLVKQTPHPHIQQPSLVVLIGSAEKSAALRALFGLKRIRGFTTKPKPGEVHLHLDPSSVFNDHCDGTRARTRSSAAWAK